MHKQKSAGFTTLELLIVVAIAMVLVGIATPNFIALLQSMRRDGTVQYIVGDIRKARSEAVRTGWQYRIYGYKSGAGNNYANQYRVMARLSSAVAWPTATDASYEDADQILRDWVDIDALYPGVTLNLGGAADFAVAFDSRGVRTETSNFDPLVVSDDTGTQRSIRVSAVGNVRIE
jgi:type IV fimbrial biogenesis protein FimT